MSIEFPVRRITVVVEDILHEGGPAPAQPRQRGAIIAVCRNPFAGRFEPDLQSAMEVLKPLGLQLTDRLIAALGGRGGIDGYGKGAMVGAGGEAEHGALWHVPGGYAMRELLGWKGDCNAYTQGVAANGSPASSQTENALSIVPSTKKVGAPGTALDVPLTHINASYVRSHFDAIEVRVPGAPLADEIVFILAMSTGARIHARVGGLAAHAISKWDGLR